MPMPKVRKGPPPEELVRLRAALASNLRAYITVRYGSGVKETGAAEDIGRATGLGKNTVLRALGKGGDDIDIRLDTLVRLALHFDATAHDLLHDYGRPTAAKRKDVSASHKSNNERARTEGPESEGSRASLQRRRHRAA
jgi:hypothetical protein